MLDRTTGVLACVSLGPDGTAGNGDSVDPDLSGDGLSVAYSSTATNLVGGGAGGAAVSGAPVAAAAGVPQNFIGQLSPSDLTAVWSLLDSGASGGSKPATGGTGQVTAAQSTNGTVTVTESKAAPPTGRAAFLAPAPGTEIPLVGAAVTFTWTPVANAGQYLFEFTGPGRQFANPNGTATDPVNGSGGAGAQVVVPGTSFTAPLGASLAPGTYQVRVIGLGANGQPGGTFSDALTVVLNPAVIPAGATDRPFIVTPADGRTFARGTAVTFAWTPIAGVAQYGFEFTGVNRQFANPNGSTPDGVNGFGGAGGGFAVPAANLTVVLPPTLPPGSYQVRVIGLSATGALIGRFSDALTVTISL